jgi:hypothetical protein
MREEFGIVAAVCGMILSMFVPVAFMVIVGMNANRDAAIACVENGGEWISSNCIKREKE